jgi:hypothetical protein
VVQVQWLPDSAGKLHPVGGPGCLCCATAEHAR